jgi:hypothetical protein
MFEISTNIELGDATGQMVQSWTESAQLDRAVLAFGCLPDSAIPSIELA